MTVWSLKKVWKTESFLNYKTNRLCILDMIYYLKKICHVMKASISYENVQRIESFVRTPFNKVTEAEQELLILLFEDPASTYSVLAEKLGVSRKTISSRIKSFKNKGILQRIGSDTKGYWQINHGQKRKEQMP